MSYLTLEASGSESECPDGNRYPKSSGNEEIVVVDVHENKGCSIGQAEMQTPVLQHVSSSTSQEFSFREESLSGNENDQSHLSLESMETSFINQRKSQEETEGNGSPDKEDYRRSLSAMLNRSLVENQEQARFQVELSRPHSQQQMQPFHLAAQAVSQPHLQEAGTGDWKPQHVVMSESAPIPLTLSDEFLSKKGPTEVGGRKPLPHPQKWFVSLDGHSSVHVRHSYIDIQTTGRNGINNSGLDSGDDMNERKQQVQKDSDEVDQSGSECGAAACSPENNTPRCVLEGGTSRSGGQLPSLQEETKRSVGITGHHEEDCDGNDVNEPNQEVEGEKTPWQKREERPVMAFNLK
ncbi:protein FAM171A1-like [Ahaetulla prasina]|uniref:protein FAM171A1-like n=1 Tax=Ahaetulla prasina TaxID=499056 RepID=UPI002649CBCD|nr:protein FAM171A1-like [Ahaetulla prasina]